MEDQRGSYRSGGGELAGVQEDDRWPVGSGGVGGDLGLEQGAEKRRGWGGGASNEIRVRASPPPSSPLGLYTARAANGPTVICGPCRVARRAEASAQARPATCRGPARARFQPCRAVLGPGRNAVPQAVPRAHGLHAHLYPQQSRCDVPLIHAEIEAFNKKNASLRL